jgi:hypothetical protein
LIGLAVGGEILVGSPAPDLDLKKQEEQVRKALRVL